MKKVFIIDGIHGVGKTTLVETISYKLNIPMKPEMSLAIIKGIIGKDDYMAFEYSEREDLQKAIVYAELAQFQYFIRKYDIFIADRSPLSAFAYSSVFDILMSRELKNRVISLLTNDDIQYEVFLIRPTNFKYLKLNENGDWLRQLDRQIATEYNALSSYISVTPCFVSSYKDMNILSDAITTIIRGYVILGEANEKNRS